MVKALFSRGFVERSMLLALAVMLFFPTAGSPASAEGIQRGSNSGLPLPRFVSLKSERVNMRVGPGRDYEVEWRYVKRGLPLEIIQEYDNWRKVRDWEGSEGWILQSLLSGARAAIVAPWDGAGGQIAMRREPRQDAPVIAQLEPRVIAQVVGCADHWCELSVSGANGYVSQNLLWGVYPNEEVHR